MTNHATVYYVPLSIDGTPKSSVPIEAHYDSACRMWVNEHTGFTVEFLGLVEGLDGAYSSHQRDDVMSWLDTLDIEAIT